MGLQDFLKRLLPKLSATRTLRLCRSLCLRHLREIVCIHLRALPLSVCLLYVVGLLYHSIFRKNLMLSSHIMRDWQLWQYDSIANYRQVKNNKVLVLKDGKWKALQLSGR